MKVLCVSTSNTKNIGAKSTSTKVCKLISEIITKEYDAKADIEVFQLSQYDLKSCTLCGNCSLVNQCVYDDNFNLLLDKMHNADCIFWVVPHYSPIPSKLIMIFEKINEISYAAWIKNPKYKTPFYKKINAIIGHGGMPESEEVLKYYHDKLVTPVANALASLSFRIIPASTEFPKGAVFGLANENCVKPSDTNVFPDIIQDFNAIEERIKPLIKNTMDAFHETIK